MPKFKKAIGEETGRFFLLRDRELLAHFYSEEMCDEVVKLLNEKSYRCPVCGEPDPNAYMRCNRPDCTDGRDPR